jgi:hypothetical protein
MYIAFSQLSKTMVSPAKQKTSEPFESSNGQPSIFSVALPSVRRSILLEPSLRAAHIMSLSLSLTKQSIESELFVIIESGNLHMLLFFTAISHLSVFLSV